MTTAAYIRVSTQDQNLYSQKEEITKWLCAHGYDLEQVQWFEDKYTGKTIERPAFSELQKAIFNGTVKTVIVWKLNRIGRRFVDGVNIIADWCDKDVRLISITQQFDLSGSLGKAFGSFLFALSENDLESNKEDQRRGIEAAKKRGVYKGRKLGSTKASPKRAKELREKGLKASEIATALNVSKSVVYRYLKAG